MRSPAEVAIPHARGDAGDRAAAIGTLAGLIAERAATLEDTAVEALAFPRSVVRADIALTLRRLRALPALLAELDGRAPVGTVALCLPGNVVLSNPAATIAASYLAGNRTLVRLPRRRRAWADVLADLVESALPGAAAFSDLGGEAFIGHAMADRAVGTVMAFGHDRWGARYEDVARRTGTRFVFEGPGKDPFVVLGGADVAGAAAGAVAASLYNAGQACTAPERVYVHADCHDAFVETVVDLVHGVVAGDPRCEATAVGPLPGETAAHVAGQVRQAVAAGATLRCGTGGGPEDGRGVLVAPTVLVGVDNAMAVMREETFGPVIPICRVESAMEAVRLSEDSAYGLSATVYGAAPEVTARLGRTHGEVFSDETWLEHRRRVPLGRYGGRRRSGWVWEWSGDAFVRRDGPRLALHEFTTSTRQGAAHA